MLKYKPVKHSISLLMMIQFSEASSRWGRKVSPLELVKEGEVAPVYTSD
jgi:hypothetical protein